MKIQINKNPKIRMSSIAKKLNMPSNTLRRWKEHGIDRKPGI